MDFTFLNLNVIWFVLVGVLFIGYTVLDGFDLGVGGLHLFSNSDEERRVSLNAIGPVWDGNEVWLITGGGALFAAFPDVYATLASGLYLVVMLLLCCLIFRAVSIEFRSKLSSALWRQCWDVAFAVSSVLTAFVLGVAAGNLAGGLPIGFDKEYAGGFWNLFSPHAVLIGITTVVLFMLHGAVFLLLKTDGDYHQKIRRWGLTLSYVFIGCYVVTALVALISVPALSNWLRAQPILWLLPLVNLIAILNIPLSIRKGCDLPAMLWSGAVITTFVLMLGFALFPNLVPSTIDPAYSLTISNASASPKSLSYMLNIALIGLPFVLAYTFGIYWVFRGKVQINAESY